MKKYIIIVAIIIVIIAIAFFSGIFSPLDQTGNTSPSPSSTITRNGTVVEVNRDQAAFDGPLLITIQGSDSARTTIAIPSMGLPLCAAYKAGNIKDPYTIEVGQPLAASGALSEDGNLVPCESAEHYVR